MRGLRSIREAKMRRYSRESVAEAVGISVYKLMRMEDDPSRIPDDTAEKLADILECDKDDLFLATNVISD